MDDTGPQGSSEQIWSVFELQEPWGGRPCRK